MENIFIDHWFTPAHFGVMAQFNNGMRHAYGKNRVQHKDLFWTYYKFSRFTIYQYDGGDMLAEYTARNAQNILKDLERRLGYSTNLHINFIIYNKQNEFEQSNIDYDDDYNGTGGVTEIASSNVFLYFEGDYTKFYYQLRKGLAEMLVNRMMFGDNWKEVIKNATLLTVPEWYTQGLVSYVAHPWSVEIDNRVKDGVLTNRYKHFNHLDEPDKTYAGHAIWNYIAEVYGPEVIPNVLYMARVSRSIESGFMFVLGTNLIDLTKDTWMFYQIKYEMDDEGASFTEDNLVYSKTRKKREYFEVKRSPDGRYLAYATNKLGKYKVILYDIEKKKRKTLLKGGIKLDRLPDYTYPLLAWRDDGSVLAVFSEKKAEPNMFMYDVNEKKKFKRPVFRVDKVLSASFSPDGSRMILSAMLQGQTDLWEYNLRANTVKQLTKDMYDDLDPAYANDNDHIVFASNRPTDTLIKYRGYLDDLMKQKDIYLLKRNKKDLSLTRLTNTPLADESAPYYYKPLEYVYLSDENGIKNRWMTKLDSVVSHIDTLIHYRYVTESYPLTNYSRSILEHQINPETGKSIDLVFKDHRYQIYSMGISDNQNSSALGMKETSFKEKERSDAENPEDPFEVPEKKVELDIRIVEEAEPDSTQDESLINIHDYTFLGEERKDEYQKIGAGQFTTLVSGKQAADSSVEDLFAMPQKRNYNLNFSYTKIVSTLDFNFADQLYQPFNGGPYTNPGLGLLMKVGMLDLFQNYKLEGGFRYGFSNSNIEFFLSLHDRSRRLDKRYTLKRQSLKYVSDAEVTKVIIYKGEYGLNYPFSEVMAVRGELSYRNDRTVHASISDASLVQPDDIMSQAGLKLELVFDNTRKRGLNLYYGTRFKIFGERYQLTDDWQSDLNVVGLDFRHYQKISRDFIYAGRVAASTTFGNRKIVYYLGSVDDWIVLSPDRERFNRQTPIAQDQNYTFQALASPMRGFIQNARNGNSFVVINNELRFPLFKYFARRPLKSDFTANFQVVAFGDVGTAWNGQTPFSDDNEFNTITTVDGPVTVKLDNKRFPIIGSYGAGIRTKLLGYFLKFDLAYGVDDGIIQDPITHISMGFDF
ncbi:hypothetical protein KFE98_05595 [bacterium SCSIO 12741]|nr:hypothetical protein KFE98_05595 [bacterium SCSIO 12741]